MSTAATGSDDRRPRCHRLILGHAHACPAAHGMMDLELWCPVCLAEYDAWCDEQAEEARLNALAEGALLVPGEAPEDPPSAAPAPPAARPWPVSDDLPAWSYHQVTDPSPN